MFIVKFRLIFLISMIFLLCPILIRAEDFQILVPEKTITIYAGEKNIIHVLIKNNLHSEQTLYFSVWPVDWVTLEKYWLVLEGDETKNISALIEPPREIDLGLHSMTFKARSVDTNASSSATILFNLKRLSDVYLTEVKLNKQLLEPGDILVIQLTLTNLAKDENAVLVTTEILKEDLSVEMFEDEVTIERKSSRTLTYQFPVEIKNPHGDYEVRITLKNHLNKLLDEKKKAFQIKRTPDSEEFRKKDYKPFYVNVVIGVKNTGNIQNANFTVTEYLPKILRYFFYPKPEPTFEIEKNNRIVYSWEIKNLDPGEMREVTYQLRFINIVVMLFLLIIIIVFLIWYFYKPSIRKRHKGKLIKDEEVSIALHIKNKSRKPLNNIIVKDFVPGILSVVRKFDTLKPEIKRKDTKTDLTWYIKKIGPMEEKVLTYRIKPMLEIVEDLKLPKAHFVYETEKGKIVKIPSKTITIKGKIK